MMCAEEIVIRPEKYLEQGSTCSRQFVAIQQLPRKSCTVCIRILPTGMLREPGKVRNGLQTVSFGVHNKVFFFQLYTLRR